MNTPTTPPTSDTPDTPDRPDLPDTPQASDSPTDGPTTTPTDHSLADEVFVDDGRTTVLPTATTATTATATVTAPAPAAPATPATPAPAPVPEPEWLKGPAPFALVLGLLGLLVAGSTLIGELSDVNLPWNDMGPWSVVAAGLVVLIVGAIGLRSSRARR